MIRLADAEADPRLHFLRAASARTLLPDGVGSPSGGLVMCGKWAYLPSDSRVGEHAPRAAIAPRTPPFFTRFSRHVQWYFHHLQKLERDAAHWNTCTRISFDRILFNTISPCVTLHYENTTFRRTECLPVPLADTCV